MSIILNGKGMVFQQIVDYYKRYITLGIIKEDEKLPSCRNLASELGINPNTVERAYKILEQEGYIKNIAKEEKINQHLLDIKNSGISKNDLLILIDKLYEKEESIND